MVHFAAESHVDRSITGPDAFIETNVVGTHTLLKAAREVWLAGGKSQPHRFHHVSTDEVYGSLSTDAPGFHEQQKYEPNSPYSASKAASDHLVRAYHHTYGLQVSTSNCSNNYGPYHFPEKLIPLCLTNILRGRRCRYMAMAVIFATGCTWRITAVASNWYCKMARWVRPTISVATMSGTTWISCICCVIRWTRVSQQTRHLAQRFPAAPGAAGGSARDLITFVEDRAGHDWRYAIDAGKITRELGYRPTKASRRACSARWTGILVNEEWWQPLLPD